LEIGRTSCSAFLANQLRVLLTAAAYVLGLVVVRHRPVLITLVGAAYRPA
jgi:hypothetical protein